jgi:hypothetical protein
MKKILTAFSIILLAAQAQAQNCKVDKAFDVTTGITTIATRNVSGSAFKPRFLPVGTALLINKNDTAYQLTCTMTATVAEKGEGVVFLLDNGYQYEYPASKVSTETDTKKGVSNNLLVAKVLLSKQDMLDFSRYSITNMKILGHQVFIQPKDREKIKENINCLLAL